MSLTFPRYCHDYTQALAAADLALPLIILLAGQVVLMFIFTYFVVFNIMGRDYDAAVLAAGTCGFGMGATPNAMEICRQSAKNTHRPLRLILLFRLSAVCLPTS